MPDSRRFWHGKIFDLHEALAQAGWVHVDFYDGSLLYDFESDHLWVIDLDNYHEGAFPNEMGRMFGSTRFMAPEEFELGALIDQRTTVYVMARTALIFLSDGTLDPDKFRGSEQLLGVARRACEADKSRRFDSMSAFIKAWRIARAHGGEQATS